jgi:hypothetical protein
MRRGFPFLFTKVTVFIARIIVFMPCHFPSSSAHVAIAITYVIVYVIKRCTSLTTKIAVSVAIILVFMLNRGHQLFSTIVTNLVTLRNRIMWDIITRLAAIFAPFRARAVVLVLDIISYRPTLVAGAIAGIIINVVTHRSFFRTNVTNRIAVIIIGMRFRGLT